MKPDMVSQWPPTELAEGYYWEAVRENYTLEDQGRVMHIYYVEPAAARRRACSLAYLPKEKLLIENDIVNTNNRAGDADARHDDALQPGAGAGARRPADRADPRQPMPWSDFAKMFPAQPRQTASAQ